MKVKDFGLLKIGDKVKVRDWDDMAAEYGTDKLGNIDCDGRFTKEMKQFCGKSLEITDINCRLKFVRLAGMNYTFTSPMIDIVKQSDSGYMTYVSPIEKKCGKIGDPTILIDYDGEPLFVGDMVQIMHESDIGVEEFLKDHVTCFVVKNNDKCGAFVAGIKNVFNEYNQRDGYNCDYIVTKIVDHEHVASGAILNGIKFVRS